MSERGATDFRERARVEADRYGPDPWIFVRELLQNARDAGASVVVIEVDEHDSLTRIRCRDDGEGMTYDHARRYLFSLYASSKEDRANQVGRFGVGFWSILRFKPTHITIRSCARAAAPTAQTEPGSGWEVVLDGELQNAERAALAMSPGTEIILERAATDGNDERRIYEAAYQNARFLCCRDQPERPLPITINGRSVNAPFALPAPSSAFRRGHVQGIVGLGSAPRVELFSRGLRVRAAACLEDLLSQTGHTGHSRVRFPELPGGLAPQALLESDGLELLLSRSDARDTWALRRLVRLGQQELRSLVEQQLSQIRPPDVRERFISVLQWLAGGNSIWRRALVGASTGAVLAILASQLLWPNLSFGPFAGAGVDTVDRTRYTDLRKRYHGPQVSELDPAAAEPLALHYGPTWARPYFAALIIEEVTGDARITAPVTTERYPTVPCVDNCVAVYLPINGSIELPLPIPTGHRLDVDSLEFDPEPINFWFSTPVFAGSKRVYSSRAGEAVLFLDWPVAGTLRYRTGPGPAISIPSRSDEALPAWLHERAFALREQPFHDRVSASIDLVRELVRYETSREVAVGHQQAVLLGHDFVTRTLAIGAGDCDVQNGLLVAVLHAADVDARLAVGWVGRDGSVSGWLHAWAEYLGPYGTWRVADATVLTRINSPTTAGLPPPDTQVAIGSDRPIDEAPGDEPSAGLPTLDPGPAAGTPSVATRSEPATEGRAARLVDRLPPALLALLNHPWFPWLVFGFGGVGLVFGLVKVAFLGRTARQVSLDKGGDLSALLSGALAQPAAFAHLPSLFTRRLIPLRGGSAISLDRARALASDGRLYVGAEPNELSQGARRRRLTVLDANTTEGRTVAASLGATDLDRWGRRLEQATELAVLGRVAAYLREHNERWRCVALAGLAEQVASLDLRPLGSSRRLGDRLVFVTAADPVLVEAERMASLRPQAAMFALLDHILDHLDLGSERRAQLLAPLAARALDEAVDDGVAVAFSPDPPEPPV